jgi:hypothetical protein
MSQMVDIAKLRAAAPKAWNDVWRIIKTDAPDFAAFMRDPFLAECIEHFDATIQFPLNDFPERARSLIPPAAIIN